MKYLYVVALLVLASPIISASQTITISGQIKDKDGAAIAHATVTEKESTFSTVTDDYGKFSITISKLPATLIIQTVGYEKKELVIKKKDSTRLFLITLDHSTTTLNEVVVVGYGIEKNSSATRSRPALTEKVAGIRTSTLPPRSPSDRAPETSGTFDPDSYRRSGRTDIKIGSKILTAGELSDFKKWKLWEGYSKDEFREHSRHWGISPVQRYCLQVQNKEGKAIVGEKAYLIEQSTNDTIWTAVTDNTGKAELWANIKTTGSEQDAYMIVCGTETFRNPSTFENGINRITLSKTCTSNNIADIAFVVDATGSMGDEIKYLQEELQDVIANISSKNKGLQLRTGSVFYRDHTDDYVTRVQDFDSNVSSLINFIQAQRADGGGDFPEAVDDALHAALNTMRWSKDAKTKIVFLVLDAPPHDRAKERMKALMIQAAAMGVRIVPIACSGINKSTEYLLRSMALTTNGSYVFLTDDSGVGNPHIKPTTDNFKVELLNDLLQRLIAEMIYTESCTEIVKTNLITEDAKNDIAKITASPNPTAGRVQIRSSVKIKELYVTDFAGKILERINTGSQAQTYQADLSKYPSGTYLVSYFVEDKGWGVKKLLLMK